MSDVQWEQWGKQDPYFGVYSESRFSKDQIDNHREEFFATGTKMVDVLLDRAKRYFGPLPTGRVLEFGSGVGRMTVPLARHFGSVVGLDISPHMIAEAIENCKKFDISNASFVISDDELSKATGMFDLVLSYIVLQHIEPERGLKIIDRLLSRVSPGGIAVVQASVRRPETGLAAKFAITSGTIFPGSGRRSTWFAARAGRRSRCGCRNMTQCRSFRSIRRTE